ncbi:MAG: hypothetical protein F4Z16_06745 [Rhodothermaceae bacterium]|nr:hypothetical protein [Rhodothermaceae bacterium]MYD66817.1 hypothetical protein [Rhodothermaceae bacterium]MYJ08398.1 hypothetical protein [Rhodothermaceae bacterium]
MATKKKQTDPDHPHIRGRKEMERMFGDLAYRRRQWMTAALIAMTVSIILAIGMVTLVLTDRNVPWIVEVDELGDVRVAAEAASTEIPEHTRVAALHRLIRNMRQIPGDSRILTAQHQAAQAYLANPARQSFIQDLQNNSEALTQMLSQRHRRYVTGIKSVLALPNQRDLYRITWTEEYEGGRSDKVGYEGYFQIQQAEIPTDEVALLNPLGLFITEYTISPITSDS